MRNSLHRQCLLALLTLAIAVLPARSQVVGNLDFETASGAHPDRPFGWIVVDDGGAVVLDSMVVRSGRTSLRIGGADDRGRLTLLASQRLPADRLRGDVVTLRGWIRTDSLETGGAGLWLRTEGHGAKGGPPKIIALANMAGRRAAGTTTWERYQVRIAVDSAATTLVLGVLSAGKGTAWFDRLELEADGVQLDPAALAWRPTAADTERLRDKALALRSVAPGPPFSDLEPLADVVNRARVIGLGEATHGTREFFRFKHRLVSWLVETRRVTAFAIEAGMAEARRVNEYVVHGRGDPQEALAGLGFWTWNSAEVLDLLKWMRNYNASGRGTVAFRGFDMQDPVVAVDSVKAFVVRADPAFLPRLESAYRDVVAAWDRYLSSGGRDTTAFTAAGEGAAAVLAHLEKGRGRYLPASDSATVDWAVQYARLVVQAMAAQREPSLRDAAMADNVAWLLEREPPGGALVLWAHNGHIARAPGAMGASLNKRLGDGYRAIGFAFGDGNYTASGVRGLAAYVAPPPPAGTVEEALRSVGLPLFALNLATASGEGGVHWLRERHPMRAVGAVAADMAYTSTPLATSFDALIYVDRSTATRLLGRP